MTGDSVARRSMQAEDSSSQGKARVGVQIGSGHDALVKAAQTRRRNHRRVVGRQWQTRDEHRQRLTLPSCQGLGPEAAVRGHAA